MTRQYIMLAGLGALALAILGVAASDSRSADDEPIVVPKDIADAVNQMADAADKGGNLKKPSEEFFKKHGDDLKKAMYVFKPREKNGKGGFGVGKPGQYTPDGIEGIIITQGNPRRKPMTPKELKDAAADFTRMADVSIAMAEVAHQYVPKKKEPDKDPKDWTKFSDEMKKGAMDLKAGVKANDPAATKTAFTKLYSSCTNCHAKFRD